MTKRRSLLPALLVAPLMALPAPIATAAPTNAPAARAAETTTVPHATQAKTAPSGITPAKTPGQPDNTTDYLFAYFTGAEGSDTDEQIYFSTSEDGSTWHDTRKAGDPALTWDKQEKGVRDPYMVRSADGKKTYLIATDLSIYHRGGWGNADATNTGSKDLVIWESDDLINWSEPRAVDVASKIKGAGMAWAPEAIWDEDKQQYMVFWATASDEENEVGDSTNMYYATTRDFKAFSDPVKWIDRDHSIIDTTVMKAEDGWYYRASGDGQITVERSRDPYATSTSKTAKDGNGWDYVGTLADTFGTDAYSGAKLEGPELFRYNDDDIVEVDGVKMPYGLMADQYAEGKGYLPFRTADVNSTDKSQWSTADDVDFGDLKKRHGTILPITAEEKERILAKYDKNEPVDPVDPDEVGSEPIAAYDFDSPETPGKDTTGNDNDLTLKGDAEVKQVDDRDSPALSLRGKGQYAELPRGLFDGRNEITVEFSSRSREKDGNFFSFALGEDQNRYIFTRLRGDEAYSAITKNSYQNEDSVTGAIDTIDNWHDYTLTLTKDRLSLYADGNLLGQTDTKTSVTDLGTGLKSYLGKSLYSADGTYDGDFDDVRIYNYAKSSSEVQGPASGLAVKDTDQILSQKATTADDGTVTKEIVLDHWADPKTGKTSDKSEVAFDYDIPEGTTVKDASGKLLTAPDLKKITDYSKPLKLTVINGNGKTTKLTVGVEVVVTPVRISGNEAKSSGIGEKDPTGNEGWKFFADPEITTHDGKYYIFPTTDGYADWAGHTIHAFASDDLVTWEDQGVVVDLKEDSDKMPDGRSEGAWAPAFAERNGKFYLYFSAHGQINVAVSDPAKGGTIDSGYEIQTVKVESSIDPGIFEDPQTGTWWLTWGQGPGMYAELTDDMLGIKPGTTVKTDATKDIREASYLTARKWNGEWTYYYTYSIDDTNSPNYKVAYATAPKLEGDGTQWTFRGDILKKDLDKGILGTAHQAVLQVPGTDDWYMAYHAFLTDEMRPRGYDSTHDDKQIATGNKREVRLTRMTYTEPTGAQTKAGAVPLIKPMDVTYDGVNPETIPEVSISGADSARPVSARTTPSGTVTPTAGSSAETLAGTKVSASFNEGWKGTSFQWYRGESKIDGATASTYTPTSTDVGEKLSVRAVGESTTGVTDNDGNAATRTNQLVSGTLTVVEGDEDSSSDSDSTAGSDSDSDGTSADGSDGDSDGPGGTTDGRAEGNADETPGNGGSSEDDGNGSSSGTATNGSDRPTGQGSDSNADSEHQAGLASTGSSVVIPLVVTGLFVLVGAVLLLIRKRLRH